jgi:S-DNA-T family DNA segregation ATPase FtsK/SpoIIIE
MLERRGVISGYEGSKPRQVLVAESDVERVVAALGERADEPPAEVELPESEPVGAEDRALPS